MRAIAYTLLLTLLVISGCEREGPHLGAEPAGFRTLAAQFKAKAGTNRRPEAEGLMAVLPTCPKTMDRDIGTGHIVAYDYSKPSFRLSEDQLLAALGQPHSMHTNAGWYETVSYEVSTGTNMPWYLSIELRGGYAVNALLHGWPPQ